MADLQDVVRAVRSRPTQVTVIGVDGHSAAGKSTLATALATEFDPVALIHGDDFYRVMDEGERADLEPAQGADLYYDWQRLRDEVLVPLRAGRPAEFHPYDWDTNQLSEEPSTIQPAPVVVVEGLFVSRPELGSLIDFCVLVAADEASPQATRSRRRLASLATTMGCRRKLVLPQHASIGVLRCDPAGPVTRLTRRRTARSRGLPPYSPGVCPWGAAAPQTDPVWAVSVLGLAAVEVDQDCVARGTLNRDSVMAAIPNAVLQAGLQ